MESSSSKFFPSFVCGPNIMLKRDASTNDRKNPINPSEPDPRAPPPCIKNPCCSCRPIEFPPPPPCFGLKLKQLENCYMGRASDSCRRRKENFYLRWQTYLDRLPKRYPNYDYTTYCCDDYFDNSVNKDFDRALYSKYKKNEKGQRLRATLNFLWPKALSESLMEQEMDKSRCYDDIQNCPPRCCPNSISLAQELENKNRLYNEEAYTRWHEKQLKPCGFTETATLVKNRTHPFKRDATFSTPLHELATGREIPYKELRDLKMI